MRVAVTSRSFSRNKELVSILKEKYQDVKVNEKGVSLQGDELISYLLDVDAAIIALEKIDREVLNRLPNLKIISKYGVGLNNLDLDAMRDKQIKLGWKAGANKRSVAELTLFFALGLIRNSFVAMESIKKVGWKQVTGQQLTNKTYGILGLGNVGQDLVRFLKPFNCNILACDIEDRTSFAKDHNIEIVDKEQLFAKSDVLSIHVPLNEMTKHLVGKDLLKLMKKESIIINTARGGIIDENALYEALKNNEIYAAALDVLEDEPLLDSPLLTLPNCFITPHIGGSALEAIHSMGIGAIEGLSQFVEY